VKYELVHDHPRYKYRLTDDYMVGIEVPQEISVETEWASLHNGLLVLTKGYMWNGPNFVRDTVDALRASLVHDAGYNLMAEGLLKKKPWKKVFDKAFYRVLRKDGMGWFMAKVYFRAVRIFGRPTRMFSPLFTSRHKGWLALDRRDS
jgi:hypothetical protein